MTSSSIAAARNWVALELGIGLVKSALRMGLSPAPVAASSWRDGFVWMDGIDEWMDVWIPGDPKGFH